jgi:hypothetical protein
MALTRAARAACAVSGLALYEKLAARAHARLDGDHARGAAVDAWLGAFARRPDRIAAPLTPALD